MEEKNICPHCGEEIEPGWRVCWNCQKDVDVLPSDDSVDEKNNNSNKDEVVMVNKQKIIEAGKQLKFIVILYILLFVLGILIAIFDTPTLRKFGAIGAFFISILMLLGLNQAGNNLIKSVMPKKNIKTKKDN